MYEFTGTVSEVCDVQTFASGFTKRELIVKEEGGEWPRNITFNFKKENVPLLEKVGAGDRVTVAFGLDGREWTDPRTNKVRHFSDLVGLGVTVLSAAEAPRETAPCVASAADSGEEMPF